MQTKPPYVYGGRSFRSLGALKDYLKRVVNFRGRVLNREFFNDVLADMVEERHYRWSYRGVRPTSFKFIKNEEGDGRTWSDSLAGYFPGWGWCRFSYNKALKNKQPTMETEFKRICRERWGAVWRERLFDRAQCEHPGCCSWAFDVDHVDPQHAEIVAQCWELLDEETAEEWWDLLLSEPMDSHFVLPEGHPVTELYDELTENGEFQLLCRHHHKAATRSRRS